MAKKAYVGIGGSSRNVSKIYVGVDGVPRKVIKGYVGVGGVPCVFWDEGASGYELNYVYNYWVTYSGIIARPNYSTTISRSSTGFTYVAYVRTATDKYMYLLMSRQASAVVHSINGGETKIYRGTVQDKNNNRWYWSGLDTVYTIDTACDTELNDYLLPDTYKYPEFSEQPVEDLAGLIYKQTFYNDLFTYTTASKTIRRCIALLAIKTNSTSVSIAAMTDSLIQSILDKFYDYAKATYPDITSIDSTLSDFSATIIKNNLSITLGYSWGNDIPGGTVVSEGTSYGLKYHNVQWGGNGLIQNRVQARIQGNSVTYSKIGRILQNTSRIGEYITGNVIMVTNYGIIYDRPY